MHVWDSFNLVSAFKRLIVEDTRSEAHAPGLTGSGWSSLPPVPDLGQQLFVRPRRIFGSPHLHPRPHSILFKGIGPNQQQFVGISPQCPFFIMVVISVPFLLFQSSKGAVSWLSINLMASQPVYTYSGSFSLVVNCIVCAGMDASFKNGLSRVCTHGSTCVHTCMVAPGWEHPFIFLKPKALAIYPYIRKPM